MPDYLVKAAAAERNNGKRTYEEMTANTNYQPPFSVGGSTGQRRDPREMERMFKQAQDPSLSDKLQRIVDMAGG